MNMTSPRLLAAASIAALLALSACDKADNTISADGPIDTQAAELAKAEQVTLPPAIANSRTYRCKDNSLIYVNFLTDGVTANVRDVQESPPRTILTAPAAGQPFVSEGFSLSGDTDVVTYTSPDSGTQSCRA